MVYIDPSFQRLFHKNTTGRLHFLNKLRFQLDTKAAVAIYKLLIIPVLTYCSVLSSFGNKSRADRINSVDSRATRIVNRHADHPLPRLKRSMLARLRVNVLMQNCVSTLQSISVC